MWAEAGKLDVSARRLERGELTSLDGLTPEEYDVCLARVDYYYQHNLVMRGSGGEVLVERDMGPRSASERGDASAWYNDKGGGRVFRWYHVRKFHEELAARGVDEVTCTEAQCMDALAVVSRFFGHRPGVQRHLRRYAGPQCWRHLLDSSRLWECGREGTPMECIKWQVGSQSVS